MIKHKLEFLIINKIAPALIKALFVLIPAKKDRLLIIKNDGIGDYILFRNFIEFIKQGEKYRGQKIYVLGNIAYKELSACLDKETVDDFLWCTEDYFFKWKLLKLLFKIQSLRFHSIIYANYSRKTSMDWIVKNANATNKIGMYGNVVNQPVESLIKNNPYYTQLINIQPKLLHEFEINRQFFEVITGEKCDLSKPIINKQQLDITDNNSIVVFIGANDRNRKWSNNNFIELSKLLISNLNINLILAGGKNEITDGAKIQNDIDHKMAANNTGELSLKQLCELIGGAKLVISGDTVAVHIAAALSIPAICISRGDLYGRFVPYPSQIENNITTVLPPGFKPDALNYDTWSSLSINAVTVNSVYNAVKNSLNLQVPVSNDPS